MRAVARSNDRNMLYRKPRILLLVLAVFFFIGIGSGFAQNSAAYRACSQKAQSQAEMNRCANEEATRADAELNRVYNKVLAKAAADPEAVAKIKAAEKAWIAYRDGYMDAMYPVANKQSEYGSIYPMEADLLRARLSRQHIVELKELLQQYSGGPR